MRSTVERRGSCPRCHGFMVPVSHDGSEQVMPDWRELPGWRCVNCGERIDPLIQANRRGADRMGTVTHPRYRCGPTMTEASSEDAEIVRAGSPVNGPMEGGRS